MSQALLAGLRVLLTRPEGDGGDDWAAAFSAAGAEPIPYPTIAILPPFSWRELDAALARVDEYDWLVFTSQSAPRFVLGRLPGQRFPATMRAKIAAVGPKTAQAIERGGGQVALQPADSRQEGLVEAFRALPARVHVLFPVAAGGRTLLAQELRSHGCGVDVVVVYRTEPRTDIPSPPAFDVATFASPSALRAFVTQVGHEVLREKIVAVIGPTTAEEALSRGLRPVIARKPGVDALVRAIAESRQSQGDP
jgi:uroporphyrinogen III methyltransferase / synthase